MSFFGSVVSKSREKQSLPERDSRGGLFEYCGSVTGCWLGSYQMSPGTAKAG